jgi:hypothetical protein
MAHTWKYALGLGLMGAALSVGCTVSSGDDDSGFAGESGAGGSTSGSGGKGGTTSTGGAGGSTGGTTGGSSGKGGSGGSSATGGAAGAGTGGTTGGTSGSGGTTGGTGGDEATPMCDPLEGSTPWPDCKPTPGSTDAVHDCEVCVQEHCCEESMNCYATDPYNVCGWGGPDAPSDASMPDYSGAGEIGCYTACVADYVAENEVCDQEGIDSCIAMCVTPMCGTVPGDATNALATCINENCPSKCFAPTVDTCN